MQRNGEQGYILVTVLLVLALVGLLGVAALNQSSAALRQAGNIAEEERAFYAANAGAEYAIAYVLANHAIPPTHSDSFAVGAYQSAYTVTFSPTADGNILATSTGTSGSATRVVTVTLRVQPGVPAAYRKVAYGMESLDINNNANICGDVYSAGNLSLRNNAHIYADYTLYPPDKSDKGQPGDTTQCANGSQGTAIVLGTLTLENNAVVDGEWCDATHPGPLCDSLDPDSMVLPDPQWGDLKAMAQTDGTYFPTDQSISGPVSDGVYYVEGNLRLRDITILGKVTFVATGETVISGSAVLGSSCVAGQCAAAYLSQGAIHIEGSHPEVWGFLVTTSRDGLHSDNNSSIHGTVVAPIVDIGNNSWLISEDVLLEVAPPGLPGADTESGMVDWGEAP